MTNNKILNRLYDVTPFEQLDEVAKIELAEVLQFEAEDEETTEKLELEINGDIRYTSEFGGLQLC